MTAGTLSPDGLWCKELRLCMTRSECNAPQESTTWLVNGFNTCIFVTKYKYLPHLNYCLKYGIKVHIYIYILPLSLPRSLTFARIQSCWCRILKANAASLLLRESTIMAFWWHCMGNVEMCCACREDVQCYLEFGKPMVSKWYVYLGLFEIFVSVNMQIIIYYRLRYIIQYV